MHINDLTGGLWSLGTIEIRKERRFKLRSLREQHKTTQSKQLCGKGVEKQAVFRFCSRKAPRRSCNQALID